ncbi:MAG: protein-methionine-sulfoxide reductase heme-binding subunit MsrQ [Pseudomonadota bacterium]
MSAAARVDWVARSKGLLLPALAVPLALVLWRGFHGHLADPAKALVDTAGLWALHCLLLSLAMTPLRILTGRSFWIRYRRLLGVYALFYALLHVSAYVFLLFGARWDYLGVELTKRPYVMVGALALLLMLPLGITSTRGWQRRLKKGWVRLHKLVYPLALLALIHFAWVKKLGFEAVWPYAAVLFLLYFIRIWRYFRQSNRES